VPLLTSPEGRKRIESKNEKIRNKIVITNNSIHPPFGEGWGGANLWQIQLKH